MTGPFLTSLLPAHPRQQPRTKAIVSGPSSRCINGAMRGRDKHILPSPSHGSTTRYVGPRVAPVEPSAPEAWVAPAHDDPHDVSGIGQSHPSFGQLSKNHRPAALHTPTRLAS